MKKFTILSIFFALAVCSCVREELEPKQLPSNAIKLVFEGGFGNDQTKMLVNDAVDGVHSLVWSEGDEIGIFSYEQSETYNNNVKAKLHHDFVGTASGVFYPVEEVVIIPPAEEGGEPIQDIINIEFPQRENETFVVYYPYKKGTELNVDDGCIHSKVANEQVQAALGDRKAIANGFASGIAHVKAAEGKATFALDHKLAYVAVKATSSEFSGYQLHSVQLFDRSGLAKLSGGFYVEPLSSDLTVIDTLTNSSVRVNVAKHDFNMTPERSELYLTVLPGDYSAADMYISVTFINAVGATKTIPMKFNKTCIFPSGSFTTIDLGDLGSSNNEFDWYEISEERDLLNLWAYGSQNTYFGCRYEADNTPDKVIIDVKPRGDFSKVKQPKYYSILCAAEQGDPFRVNYRRLLSIDGSESSAAVATPVNLTDDGYAPKGKFYPVESDYTISVHVMDLTYSSGRWGSLALYDDEFNIIWTYMVIGYREGDAPKDVQYPGFTMMDRFLGQGRGNAKAAELGDFDTNISVYFQWGRPHPFANTNTQGLAHIYTYRETRFESFEEAISHPTTKVNTNSWPWYPGDIRYDLWGGYNNTENWYDPNEKGHKTIYDPCPAGYRIPDARVFKEVGDNAEIWECPNNNPSQVTNKEDENYHINPNSPFYGKNQSVLAYPISADSYDYWPFFGYLAGVANSSYGGMGAKALGNLALLTWANTAPGAAIKENSARGVALEYAYFNSSHQFNERHQAFQTYACPVRCQKED